MICHNKQRKNCLCPEFFYEKNTLSNFFMKSDNNFGGTLSNESKKNSFHYNIQWVLLVGQRLTIPSSVDSFFILSVI